MSSPAAAMPRTICFRAPGQRPATYKSKQNVSASLFSLSTLLAGDSWLFLLLWNDCILTFQAGFRPLALLLMPLARPTFWTSGIPRNERWRCPRSAMSATIALLWVWAERCEQRKRSSRSRHQEGVRTERLCALAFAGLPRLICRLVSLSYRLTA